MCKIYFRITVIDTFFPVCLKDEFKRHRTIKNMLDAPGICSKPSATRYHKHQQSITSSVLKAMKGRNVERNRDEENFGMVGDKMSQSKEGLFPEAAAVKKEHSVSENTPNSNLPQNVSTGRIYK